MSPSLSPTSARRVPTTARGSPVGGIVVAVLLHAAIIAATLFSFQHKLEIVDESPPSIPVDLVTIADKTNVAPTVQRSAPKPDVVNPPPQPVPAPPAPTPPQAQAAPEPAPVVKPKPAPPPLPKPVAKVEPKPAPTPAPAKPKPKTDDVDALLAKLSAPAAAPRNARLADRSVKGVGAMNAETADLVTALKGQIAQCWSPPTGVPHAEQLIPVFRIALNPDGTVVPPPQLSADSAAAQAGDPFMRAAVEAARRAIMTCGPYKLPADKYATWRDITIDFDPRNMTE